MEPTDPIKSSGNPPPGKEKKPLSKQDTEIQGVALPAIKASSAEPASGVPLTTSVEEIIQQWKDAGIAANPDARADYEALEQAFLDFCNNPEQTNIDLTGNIKSLPDVWHLPPFSDRLQQLFLCGCNNLTKLPESIVNCTALTVLGVQDCQKFACFPESIGKCTALTILHLTGLPEFTHLPESIGHCRALTELRITYCNKLANLPESIVNCTALTLLSLSDCKKVTCLPANIGNCTALIALALSDCENLTKLPDSIGQCTALIDLLLQGCKVLPSLPESIGNCTALTYLELSSCDKLTYLPESIGNCTALQTLILTSCPSLQGPIPTLPPNCKVNVSSCPLLQYLLIFERLKADYRSFNSLTPEEKANPEIQRYYLEAVQRACAYELDGKGLTLAHVPAAINEELKQVSLKPSSEGTYKETLVGCAAFIGALTPDNRPPSLLAYDTTKKLEAHKEALKEALKKLTNRIEKQEAYLGTPGPGTPELKLFYDQVKYYLSDLQEHLDPSKDAEEYVQLLEAASVCGGGLIAHLDQLHTRLCSADSSLSTEAILTKQIGGEVKSFIESKNTTVDVHFSNACQWLLREYIGGNIFYDRLGTKINEVDILKMFYEEMTVARALAELANDLKNNEPLQDRLIEYIETPLYQGDELKEKDAMAFETKFKDQLKNLITLRHQYEKSLPPFEVLQKVAQTTNITILQKQFPNLQNLKAILDKRDIIVPLVEVITGLHDLTGLSSQKLLTIDKESAQRAFVDHRPMLAQSFYADKFLEKYRNADGSFEPNGLAIVLNHIGLIRAID